MGSKSRIAKYIVPIIQKSIDDSKYEIYIEPFGGGMNVIDKISRTKRYGCDLNKYLIQLFIHLQSGGSLPEQVPRDIYSSIRSNPDQFDDTEKLKATGKLEAKLAQREKLMNIEYAQLPEEEKEKDRVVARALLQALTGK